MADIAEECYDGSVDRQLKGDTEGTKHRTMANPGTSPFSFPFLRRRQSYTINPPDDTYHVIYLGNVLTVMAKGDSCVEKPLSLIWKTYCNRRKSSIHMKLAVTRSGLKAETKQQGLTEYWAHRITFCIAPPEYPRLFCWVYKHEGKRMKPELRCHAVLCKKSSEPNLIALRLNDFLQAALQEYRREKLCMQNARLNATAVGQVTTCPKRKLILQTGSLNFRPPVSRSKSAPRLVSIDEEDEIPDEHREEDLSDLDSLCFRESPNADDECASSSAASSTSSSPFLPQNSFTGRGERDVESEVSECTMRVGSSLALVEEQGGVGSDEGFNSNGEVNEQASGALYGPHGTGLAWVPLRRASAIGLVTSFRRQWSQGKDPDAVSDESGYQDGAVSFSDDECVVQEEDEDDFDVQVTAL